MELVRAWSLEQAVGRAGRCRVVQAAEIGIRVLDALRHAHAAGVLHRDVKPGNVLLTADRVVLTDFGIAAIEGDVTITQTGLLMGSPAYIPPERLSGQRDHAAGRPVVARRDAVRRGRGAPAVRGARRDGRARRGRSPRSPTRPQRRARWRR